MTRCRRLSITLSGRRTTKRLRMPRKSRLSLSLGASTSAGMSARTRRDGGSSHHQPIFPTLDYTLSFHVGVMARVASTNKPDVNELEQLVMADVWRRWEQAGELLNEAEEAEDFQSVGMRCRECLIVMVRAISLPETVPEGSAPPKHADVVHWCELIANHIAKGSSAKDVHGYLKSISKSGCELVNCLTHTQNTTLTV